MGTTFLADYHIHTHQSGDSEAPMEDVIRSAIEKGLSEICITEHMDYDYPILPDVPKGMFEVDTDAYFDEYKKIKAAYKDQIRIKFGIELGLQPHITDLNAKYIEKYSFDFVIGSNHICHGMDPYYPDFYENRNEKEAVREFFESTLENINAFDNFDVLGHLDYLVRYSPTGESGYDYRDYLDVIEAILKTLISKGKGLDVNSKSLYSNPPLSNPNPCKGILNFYRELGGEIITLGSDAHKPGDVARGFDQTISILKSCGFTGFCTYSGRKVAFHDLVGL